MCKLTQEQSGESRGGGRREGCGRGERGTAWWERQLAVRLNMTANKRRFTFLNRKQQINQNNNNNNNNIYMIVLSVFKRFVMFLSPLEEIHTTPPKSKFLGNMSL